MATIFHTHADIYKHCVVILVPGLQIVLKLGGGAEPQSTGSEQPTSHVIGRPISSQGNTVIGGGNIPTKNNKKKSDSGCC